MFLPSLRCPRVIDGDGGGQLRSTGDQFLVYSRGCESIGIIGYRKNESVDVDG